MQNESCKSTELIFCLFEEYLTNVLVCGIAVFAKHEHYRVFQKNSQRLMKHNVICCQQMSTASTQGRKRRSGDNFRSVLAVETLFTRN